jgi:hypothetical protein
MRSLTEYEEPVSESIKEDLNFIWYEDEFVKFMYPEGWNTSVSTYHSTELSFEPELIETTPNYWRGLSFGNEKYSLSLGTLNMDVPGKLIYSAPSQVSFQEWNSEELDFTISDENIYIQSVGPEKLEIDLMYSEKFGGQAYLLRNDEGEMSVYTSPDTGTIEKTEIYNEDFPDSSGVGIEIDGQPMLLSLKCPADSLEEMTFCEELLNNFLNDFEIIEVSDETSPEEPTEEVDLNFVWYEDEFVKFMYPEGWDLSLFTYEKLAEIEMYQDPNGGDPLPGYVEIGVSTSQYNDSQISFYFSGPISGKSFGPGPLRYNSRDQSVFLVYPTGPDTEEIVEEYTLFSTPSIYEFTSPNFSAVFLDDSIESKDYETNLFLSFDGEEDEYYGEFDRRLFFRDSDGSLELSVTCEDPNLAPIFVEALQTFFDTYEELAPTHLFPKDVLESGI